MPTTVGREHRDFGLSVCPSVVVASPAMGHWGTCPSSTFKS